jgi:hypothetical protein
VGVVDANITYRVSIHEDADVSRAEAYWSDLVGINCSDLARTTLKRINTSTNRLNRGAEYNGCLVIQVRQSAGLYQRIDGAWRAIVGGQMGGTP